MQAAQTDRRTIQRMAGDDLDADVQALRERLPTLEAVERRRGQLWAIAGLLLLAASAMVFVLLFVPDAADVLPENGALRFGTGAVSVAFLLYVFDQERRMRILSRALVDERVLSSMLNERVRDLAMLSRVGRVVNSVLTTDEVLEIILRGARELTGAGTGSVLLVDGDELVVEVSAGEDAAPRGVRQSLRAGIAGRVASSREAVLISGQLDDDQVHDRRPRARGAGSSVVAPMLVDDDLVGVLALERPAGEADFTQWELRAVALFANHAATAVTNAKRYEAERANVSRLADMIERRSDFVASLVHDLKTPLTAIIGFTKLLRDHDRLDPTRRSDAFGRIEDASRDLLDMVDGLLRSASFEATTPVRPEPVELRPFIDQLVGSVQAMASADEGQPRPFRVRAPAGHDYVADPSVLRSILQNLLENSVKYSPPGTPVELDVVVRDGQVRFSVTDHGDGIAPADQEQVFERFRRSSRTDGASGVGLGLYIVRSLVRAQGGRIELESIVGAGTTFHVVLPDRRPAAAAAPSPPPSAPPTPLAPPPPPPVAGHC